MDLIPSVYAYSDYRKYLGAYYRFMKTKQAPFTFEKFARRAGLGSPNILKLVMDGRKNLTSASLLAFAKALELSGHEQDFFFHLVHWNQAKTAGEKTYFRQKVRALRPINEPKRTRAKASSGLYEDLFVTIVACCLQGRKSGEEIAGLQSELGLEATVAQFYLEILRQSGWMELRNDVWCIDASHIVFHEKVPSPTLQKFLLEQLLLSQAACKTSLHDEAKFISHVMSIDANERAEIQDKIDAFVSDLNADYERPGGVPLQVNVQSFRITPKIVKAYRSRQKGPSRISQS